MTRYTTLSLPNEFNRASIGFDRMFNELERSFSNSSAQNSYPPYNIVQVDEDEYMISLAVAGFGMDNLDITHDGNELVVEGTTPPGGEEVNYIHKGIAGRNFKRSFKLADHVQVENANLELGMLNIFLKRVVPEELQAKKIAITDTSSAYLESK